MTSDSKGRFERTESDNDENTPALGELPARNDDVVTTVNYCEDDERNLHRPRVVSVLDAQSNILRERTASYDQRCILVSMEDRHVGGINPTTGQPYNDSAGENPRTAYVVRPREWTS